MIFSLLSFVVGAALGGLVMAAVLLAQRADDHDADRWRETCYLAHGKGYRNPTPHSLTALLPIVFPSQRGGQ